jgi:hypothetical protein
MEYLEGTYISQVNANNIRKAMTLWIQNLETEEIKGFSNSDKQKLINDNFSDEAPVLIRGMKNVWHFLIITKKGTGFVNCVKTRKA